MKNGKCNTIPTTEVEECLPSVEMKFLDWKSNNSDDDGFQLVSSRKKKRAKKIILNKKGNKPREGLHSLNGALTLEGGESKICSGYNLMKGRYPKGKIIL